MTITFALNINDDNNSLSPEDGLPFGDLGLLASSLSEAINSKENEKCTLYKIENHGYTPHFITSSKITYQNFIEVHRSIYEKDVNSLTKEEVKYANTLKKVLKKGKYIEALDKDLNPVTKIYSNDIEKGVEAFNSITTITGIISEIGSQKLDDTSHIYLHGVGYKIYISPQQDAELSQYYKGAFLELKVNQRRSIKTGRIVSARLLKSKVKADLSFTESLKSLTAEDLSFLGDIESIDDILSYLRS